MDAATPPAPAPPRLAPRLAAGLFAATFLLYLPSLRNPFCGLDDEGYVTLNPHVQGGPTAENLGWAFTTGHLANWHPLTWISLQLDAAVFGPTSAAGFRFTNLALHAANAALLFGLLAAATGAPWRSLAAAALWAAHPLRVESVAWIAERKDVLSTLLGLLAVGAYGRYARAPSVGRYAAVAGLLAAGLLAKPMLVTLPVALLLLDYWPLGRTARVGAGRLVAEKLPLLAVVAAASAVTVYAQSAGDAVKGTAAFPFGERVANAFLAVAAYLRQTVWPTDMAVFYPHPHRPPTDPGVLAAAGLVAAATAVAVGWGRRFPYLPAGWFWFLGGLVPVLGLVQVGVQGRADRYTYWPGIGLAVAGVWAAADLAARAEVRPRVKFGVAGAAALALAALTWVQIGVWQSDIVLWTHTIAATAEDNAVAQRNLGLAYGHAEQFPAAAVHLEKAVRGDPTDIAARFSLAQVLLALGRDAEATREYEALLTFGPPSPTVRHNLGHLLARAGRGDEAYDLMVEIAGTDRPKVAARAQVAHLLHEAGHFAAAADQIGRAVATAPDDPEGWLRLGTARLYAGRLDPAEAAYREADRLAPGNAAVLSRVGLLAARRGAAAEGVGYCEKAVAADPRAARRAALGLALGLAGRAADAAREYEAAGKSEPGWVGAAGEAAAAAARGDPGAVPLFLADCQARAGCEATGYKHPGAVFGLAGVLAAGGQFADAEKLLAPLRDRAALAGDGDTARRADRHLALYRAGRSFRDRAGPPVAW